MSTREKGFWTQAYKSITAATLIEVLEEVVDWRGHPQYIRCDNGPGSISITIGIEISKILNPLYNL